jgi:hypothetical protein
MGRLVPSYGPTCLGPSCPRAELSGILYLVFISSIRVDPGPRNRGPTLLLALKIRTTVANTGKLRSIGQVPVILMVFFFYLFSLES